LVQFWNSDILGLSHTHFAKAPEMAGLPLRAIAPGAARSADHTRHYIALRLLPFVFVLYITNYLDRTSVAYAAIGMARDLGFNDRVFGMGIGIFFLSYVALQIPGALLVERWSARGMISATMIVWGSLTALTALVHTPAQLYLARFLLGAAEAGFLTGWAKWAAWLTPEQRQWISQRLVEEKPSNRQSFTLGQAMRSRPVLLLAAAAFLDYFAGYAVIFWFPTVLKRQSGFSDAHVGVLAAVPYAVALIAMLVNGWHSDRRRERRWHAAVPLFIAAAGSICLLSLPSSTLM